MSLKALEIVGEMCGNFLADLHKIISKTKASCNATHLVKIHILCVRTPSSRHQDRLQPLNGLFLPILLLDMQGQAAITLLLDAGGSALRMDVEACHLILLSNEASAFLVKPSQRQWLQAPPSSLYFSQEPMPPHGRALASAGFVIYAGNHRGSLVQ